MYMGLNWLSAGLAMAGNSMTKERATAESLPDGSRQKFDQYQ
jgi:hypothetical protein